jgi:hypothetical protein
MDKKGNTLIVDAYEEAAVLSTQGIPLLKVTLQITPQQPLGRVAFEFSDLDGLASKTLLSHRDGTLFVNSRELNKQTRKIKARMFTRRREGGVE